MERGFALLLVGGVAALGLLALGAKPAHAATRIEPATKGDDWIRRVITYVSAAEGKPDSLNRNLDGAGLSFGILQWNQRAGSLGGLLLALRDADPASFARLFGPSSSALLDATGRGGLEPVDGAPLWEEPWASRFVAAGRHAPFVDAQWRVAAQGDHFRGALDVARIMGVRTERAMTLFFDRSVQLGPGRARKLAETLRASWGADRPSYTERLRAFAELAASGFRTGTAPATPYFSERARHIVWKPVGNEWHAFARRWDLYADVVKRTSRILTDRRLRDDVLAEPT